MNYEDELDRSRARKSRRRESESETSAKRRTHRTEDLYSMSADPGSRAGRAAAKSHGAASHNHRRRKNGNKKKKIIIGPGVCRSGLRLYPAQLRKDERTE